METTPVERIRHAVIGHLSRLSGFPLPAPQESILIRNGLYCGRKFVWQGYEVVWFQEEDEIKFFGPCGNMLYSSAIIPFMHESNDQSEENSGDAEYRKETETPISIARLNRFAA